MRAALLALMVLMPGVVKADLALPVVFADPRYADLQNSGRVVPGQKVLVQGRVLQVEWPGGGFVSFHQGAVFELVERGDGQPQVHLWRGSLNALREGHAPMSLSGPHGSVDIGRHSSINLQVDDGGTAGRVMTGQLVADSPKGARVFGTNEGFELSASGPRRTFSPPAAPSPSPADVEPGAGADRPENPKVKSENVALGDLLAPAAVAYQKVLRRFVDAPAAKVADVAVPAEVHLSPELLIAQAEAEASKPKPSPEPSPEPDAVESTPAVPDAQPEPDMVDNVVDDPVRYGVFGGFSPLPPGLNQPNNRTADALGMLFEEGPNGEQRLEAFAAGQIMARPTVDGRVEELVRQTLVGRGTAEHADTHSNGTVAGLGRWVGGRLVAVSDVDGQVNAIAMPSHADNMGGTSTHYIWGEQATAIPTQGSLNYTLTAATTPSYFGVGPDTRVPDQPDARFDGSMRVDFAHGSNGSIGRYHFSGAVALTENGQQVGYAMATAPSGVILRDSQIGSEGTLRITATNGPGIACAGGGTCGGAISVAAYGEGVQNLGALYTIKGARSDIGLTGAALFGRE